MILQKNYILILALCISLSATISCKKKTSVKETITTEMNQNNKVKDGMFSVDASTSKVLWKGKKPAGAHNGTVNVSNGKIHVKDGKIVDGNFTLDMNSINVLDLEGDQKAYLEAHLKGTAEDNADDFFNVNKYPSASFKITKVTTLVNDPNASHAVYGDLMLKGISKPVGFKTNITLEPNSISVVAPQFNIDRTEWGIKYGSGKFFDNLKDKIINDNIELEINLNAKS